MNRSTYHVEMSTSGEHKVIVTIEDPAGTDAALAWARATYAKLLPSDTPTGDQAQDTPLDDDPPECTIHHLPLVRANGRKGPFWSCHEQNSDGSWCSYRPPDR